MTTPNALRLAEPLGSLSLATDLAVGLPVESALASTVLAVRIGERLGLPREDLSATYYASVTRFVGCTATAMEGGSLALGEDQELNMALTACDWTDVEQVQDALRRYVASDEDPEARARAFQGIREMHHAMPAVAALHCSQALILASGLALPSGVTRLLSHMYDRWDGAIPGAAGADIPLGARIIPLAVCAELFRSIGGPALAVEMVRSRGGTQFDPELCRFLEAERAPLFEGLGSTSHWSLFLDSEPGDAVTLQGEALTAIAEAFGDFVDAKSPWFMGHSRRVANLAAEAGSASGLPASEVRDLRTAGLVHDIGRAAVPNRVWDKPTSLTYPERQRAETHTYHTYEILSRSTALQPVAERASGCHERCDGSGYHRRVRLDDPVTSILCAADMYDALTHQRPWRAAYDADEAARRMVEEVSAARLPRGAVEAVLEAAGHARSVTRSVLPAGLTPREAEVLGLLAAGCSDKAIAKRLGISVKTAGHHASSIYRKTGLQGRAQIALFAMEHKALLA